MSAADRRALQAKAPSADGRAGGPLVTAQAVSYAVLLVLSVWLFMEAGDLPKSRWEPLGAGAFPRIVLGVLAALSLIALVGSLRPALREAPSRASVAGWLRRSRLALGLIVLFGLFVWAVPLVGFSLAAFVFLMLAQAMLAPLGWRAAARIVVVATLFSFGLNWLFAEVFTVFLPRGRL